MIVIATVGTAVIEIVNIFSITQFYDHKRVTKRLINCLSCIFSILWLGFIYVYLCIYFLSVFSAF